MNVIKDHARALSGSFAITLCLVTVSGCEDKNEALFKQKAGYFDEFCRMTKFALAADIRSLRPESSPDSKRSAAEFYYREAIHHGKMSVAACLRNKMPEQADACDRQDHECLSRQLSQYLDLLEKSH